MTVDIDSEDSATKSLQTIVEKWITVRGFSLAPSWTIQYKQAVQQVSKKVINRIHARGDLPARDGSVRNPPNIKDYHVQWTCSTGSHEPFPIPGRGLFIYG
jgi:hypothetical protein